MLREMTEYGIDLFVRTMYHLSENQYTSCQNSSMISEDSIIMDLSKQGAENWKRRYESRFASRKEPTLSRN